MTRIEKAKKAIDMGLGVVASGEYWVVRLVKGMDITDIPIDQWEPEPEEPTWTEAEIREVLSKHYFWNDQDNEQGHLGEEIINQLKAKKA